MPLVEIPEIGTVEFPDEMSRDDITAAIKTKIVPRARFQAFLAAPDSTLTETSPLTPSAPVTVQGNIAQPSTPTEAQQIEQQLPPGDVPAKIGEQPATIPRFGEPGSFTRGISDVISGLGEFALNKPEEVALSLYPPTAAAIGLRYGPELGKQWLEDVYHGIKGDKESAGRATALLAAVGGPLGIKRGVEAIKAAEADTVYQSQYAGLVDQLARENLRIKETPGLVTKPEPTVLEQVAPETSKAIENQPKILTPALSEQDVQRLFLEPEAKRVEQELAAAEKPAKPEAQAPVAPQVEPQAVEPAPTPTVEPAAAPAPAFATRYDPETLLSRPTWVEPGSALDKALSDVRDNPESGKDITPAWKAMTPAQRQELLARGWVVRDTRTPGQVVLGVSQDAVAARKYYGAQAKRELAPAPALTEGGAKEPWQMTQGEFVKEFQDLSDSVAKAEKTPQRKMSPAEVSLMRKDWKAYSRKRGYTESEIADFERLQNLSLPLKDLIPKGESIPFVSPENIHATFIAKAIREGKPVPQEALADYPELKAIKASEAAGETAKPAEMPSKLVPEDKGITQEQKAFRATPEGQKAMASRASRIALLNQLNEAIRKVDPNEAYDRKLLETLPDSQIDWMRDSLVKDYNRLVAKPASVAEPSTETPKPEPSPTAPGEPSIGPGAASPEAEFSPPTIDELIQPYLREGMVQTPEARAAEAPPVQTLLGRVRGLFMSGSTHPTVQAIKGWIGTVAGKTLPKTTLRDRLSGELGGRFIASRAAGAPMADVFVNDVMAGLKVDQAKFDAALKADNLLSIRDAFQAEADKLQADPAKVGEAEVMQGYADGVNTLLGTEKFPFKDEAQLQDYFKDPQVAEAILRHIDNWQATIEPLYRTTQNIDPTVELPTRGKYSGARINLNPVVKGAYEPTQGPIVGSSGNLLGTLRRRNPFANRAMGTGQSYVLNYAETMANSFAKQLEIANKKAFEDQLVRSGNAVIDNIGKHPKLADGADTKAYPLLRRGFINKSIYIRDTLSKEYEIAANVVLNPYRDSLLVVANKAFAQAALAGLTDATVHIENLGTALFQVPGATGTPLLVDSILSAMGRMDIPVIAARMGLKSAAEVGRTRLMKYLPEAIQSSINKALLKNMTQMAALAQINATRVPHGSRLPGSKQLGMAVLNADKATRMVLDDTFRNLVAQGLVKGTETARREFINQAGNYNLRAQGPWMRFIRQTYISPFATAGRNFATLGVRGITLNPGVEASSIAAAAALRANMLAKWVGTAALVATANYLITGNLMGRKGTPLGAIDTGKDDANGRAKYFNVAAFTGQSRALRTVGARGAIEAARLGLPPSDQAQAAVRDITNVGLQSVAGPGARAAMIVATGFPPAVSVGRASEVVPPGEQQWVANVKEAAWEVNPILASIHEATKPGGNMAKAIERQIPRFTLTTGKPQAMVENYPKVVAMAQANEFTEWVIHTARSLPKEERYKFVGEQINRLEPQLRQHAYREVLRRKVYSRP